MGRLVEEVREWNSPVVGAYLLWRFTQAYSQRNCSGDAPTVILHFIAHTLLTSVDYCAEIPHKKNLASFIRAFTENKKSDKMACFGEMVSKQREATMKAIDIAVATGLLVWDTSTAQLVAREFKPARGSPSKGAAIQELDNHAQKLGAWFAELDVPTITLQLGVVL